MYNKKLILPLIIVTLAVMTLPFWYQAFAGRADATAPKLELPAGKERCIESTPYMKSHHVDLLNDWKESVVRQGRRIYVAEDGKEYIMSLTNTCMDCHKEKAKFCDRCHGYVHVSPTCWSCHNAPQAQQPATDGGGKREQGTVTSDECGHPRRFLVIDLTLVVARGYPAQASEL